MFDKQFKISFKDLIFLATIFIGFGMMRERLVQVEGKVNVIYSFYVNEGMKKTSIPLEKPESYASEAILNHQELRIKKKQ